MATTTTNYGFDIPQSTDLVKDGATAIATLGQDIDTAMNTALGTKKAGMVLLNTTSFSAVASQSLTADTFTTTYDDYRVIVEITAITADCAVNFKLRKAGTDSSASYSYGIPGWSVGASAVNSEASGLTTGLRLFTTDFDANNAARYGATLDLISPKLSIQTKYGLTGFGITNAGLFFGFAGGGIHNVADTYDSLTLVPTAGNITGRISVYGYNK
jgi:hypothetical protein